MLHVSGCDNAVTLFLAILFSHITRIGKFIMIIFSKRKFLSAPVDCFDLCSYACSSLKRKRKWSYSPSYPYTIRQIKQGAQRPHFVYLSTLCGTFVDRLARAAVMVFRLAKKALKKLGRGCSDLASSQISLNSVLQFQRRCRKCLSQSEARAAMFFFFNRLEKHEVGRGCCDLASCQVSLNSVRELLKPKMSQPIRGKDGYPVFITVKRELGRGRGDLASCRVSLIFVQRFLRSQKCLSQSEARVAILVFQSAQKHKLGRGRCLEIFLPVKFHFRGEVANISANQRSGQPFCFYNRPKNTNFVEDVEIFYPSAQVH